MKIRPVEADLFGGQTDGRTDRQTDRQQTDWLTVLVWPNIMSCPSDVTVARLCTICLFMLVSSFLRD